MTEHEHRSIVQLVGEHEGTETEPWRCQVVHHELADDEGVIDLIAATRWPFAAAQCPPGTPFTIRVANVRRARVVGALGFERWLRQADTVELVFCITAGGRKWLALSDERGHLIMQLVGA